MYSGQVDAVLDSYRVLKYYLDENPRVTLTTLPIYSSFLTYGFVLPQNSPLLNKLNIDILQMQAG
jgi:ABC-type amino acid transport substrate-binding protein